MSKSYTTVVFVSYPINPIKLEFKNALYEHLMSKVWDARGGEVEEAIALLNGDYGKSDHIDTVRYQFGDTYSADEYSDDIGEHIDREVNKWIRSNGGHEVVGA